PERAGRPETEALATESQAEIVRLPFAGPRRRRRPWTLVANLFRLTVVGAVRSWRRNARLVGPALGTMALLLLFGGALGISGVMGQVVLTYESRQASVLHVYVTDGASPADLDALRHTLASNHAVRAVSYVDKEAALARAKQRPGLADLAAAADSNPFPASFEVQVDAPENVGKVAALAGSSPAVDQGRPTSYNRDTYARLRRFVVIGTAIAAGFALLVALITYAVSANSLRAVVLSRREELVTMEMLGASSWLLRGRLLTEGALTGGLAGILAALALGIAVAAAAAADRHLFVQLLPGVSGPVAVTAGAVIALVGAMIGGAGSLFALRRLPA
ncbi:MAG: permease-like cell division protein FtsX, partial [Candidatus Dormibacteraeota bacterium]|nr:permease-like cell division protein FtsX [Candidatus Dormibacteraeota bacterium]